ncbi:DUF6545 domain-containing protein [Nocardia sp. NPDC127579]|uniref:DUF6545 domain-containing protein n=1 Tax=Nocardia sp. NPDC127579 TaxID=3345402 RepID=UPI003626323E
MSPLLLASVGLLLTVVTVGRCLLLRASLFERQVNVAMVWQTVGIALFTLAVAAGAPDTAARLYLACGFMTYARLHGFGVLLHLGNEIAARRRQPTYDALGVLGSVILVGGAPPLDRAFAIDTMTILWNLSLVPLAVTVIRVAWACIHELRGAPKRPLERLAYSGVLLLAGYWAVFSVAALIRMVTGGALRMAGPLWTGLSFAALVILTLLIAIPLVIAVLARAGLDRPGRAIRTLRPLWRDLTTAVPEVVLADPEHTVLEPELRLYRMTVEIRDALTKLRREHLLAPSLDRAAELDQLLRLARTWPGLSPAEPAVRQ